MKSILEIDSSLFRSGGISGGPGRTQPTIDYSRWSRQRPTHGTQVGYCHQMRGWQNHIFTELQGGRDVYIVAKAGAGKTGPVICHWAEHILGVHTNIHTPGPLTNLPLIRLINPNPRTRESIQKLIVLVPTRQLVRQASEYKEHLAGILFQHVNQLVGMTPTDQRTYLPLLRTVIDCLSVRNGRFDARHPLQVELQRRTQMIADGNWDVWRKNHERQWIQQLGSAIGQYVQSQLVYQKSGDIGGGGDGHGFPVIVAVYESMQGQILKSVKNCGLLVWDEAHHLQEGAESHGREQNIVKAIFNVMKNLPRNSRIALLSASTNKKSAQNVCSFLNLCFNRNIKVMQAPGRNPSNVTVLADNSIQNPAVQVDILVKAVSNMDKGTVLVLFSKDQIRRLIEQAIQKLGGGRTPGQESGTRNWRTGGFFDRPSPEMFSPSDAEAAATADVGGAGKIGDELVRRAAAHKLGIIYRVGDNEPDREKKLNDNAIVQKLFQQGRIIALAATDAIHVGVNISARTMYLPTIEKFNGKIPPKDLTQLVNRVGRKEGVVGTIYTPEKYVDDVIQALNLDPEDLDVESFIKPTGGLLRCQSTVAIRLLGDLIRGLRGRTP